jgi:Na+/H+ antiporter NhaD/arsenite permease-like protein
MSVFHAIYATTVFVVAYVLIATERFNQTLVALGGAVAMFFLPVINSDEVFYSRDTGVNWDVLFLLLWMMIIVSVVRQTGLFEYVAIWVGQARQGLPAADHDPAVAGDRTRDGSSGQRDHGVADRSGDPAGVRPT